MAANDGLFDIPGNMYVRGNFRANNILIPTGSVGNNEFDINSPLAATKQDHQYLVHYRQTGTVASEAAAAVHQAYTTGTLFRVQMTSIGAAIGAATVTVVVKKNGTTVMSAPWVLTNSTAAYGILVGTLNASLTSYVLGDVFEVNVTPAVGGGTLPTGLLITLMFREAAGS